jgi:ribosomal protein L31
MKYDISQQKAEQTDEIRIASIYSDSEYFVCRRFHPAVACPDNSGRQTVILEAKIHILIKFSMNSHQVLIKIIHSHQILIGFSSNSHRFYLDSQKMACTFGIGF